MYFNDLHILYYIAFALIGLIIGQIAGKFNQKIIDNKQNKKENKQNEEKSSKYHYIIMILTSIIYVFLLYNYGLKKN